MDFTLSPEQVADLCIAQGVHPLYSERIREFADHCMTVTGRPGGDRTVSAYVAVEASFSWPLKGGLTLTRADGRKARLTLTGNRWEGKVL